MRLLLSGLLLASFWDISIWSVLSTSPTVTQTPEVIEAKEGEAVNISCCFSGLAESGRFSLLQNGTELQQTRVHLRNESLKNRSRLCATLSLPNISRGWGHAKTFVCRVTLEIPIYAVHLGNGTTVTVAELVPTIDQATQVPAIVAGAAAALLLLLVALCCFCGTRRRRARAARVIYEAPHVDSEEAEAEADKDSTGNSSQWCQVLVYESLDYFEQAQTKESG